MADTDPVPGAALSNAPELEPYLVCRMAGGQVECAVWTLREGPKALALFASAESAAAFRAAADLPQAWQVFRPAKSDVLAILRECHASGITLAVLDPDREQAKRVFDIHAILQATGELHP